MGKPASRKGRKQTQHGGVIAVLAAIERQIPVDEHRPRQLRPGQDFRRHGLQIIGHVHMAFDLARVRGNVNVRKQRHAVFIPFAFGQRATLAEGKRGGGRE